MWCSIPSKSWHASAALIPLPSSTPPSGRSSSLSGSRRCFARISLRGKSARKTISPFLPSNAFTPSLALRRWRGSLFVRPVPVHHWDVWRGIHPAARRRIVRNAHDSYHQHLLHFGSGIGLAVSRAFAPGLPPRIEDDIRHVVLESTVFTHLESLDDPASWDDETLDRGPNAAEPRD
jgi:hypothetical protein